MSLSVTIYTDSNKASQLADYTSRIHPSAGGGGLKFGSGPHGFTSCELPFVPMGIDEAFAVLNWPGLPWVVVSDRLAGVVWEGRLEGRRMVSTGSTGVGGVALTAFGAARALSDVVYTALISDTSTKRWRVGNEADSSIFMPQRWQSDNNNRLYIAPRKGEDFSTASRFSWYYEAPHGGTREIWRIDFDYTLVASSSWVARLDAESTTSEWTLTGNGGTQTGSASETLTVANDSWIRFLLFYNNASPAEFTGETGDVYLKITNIRVKGSADSTITADEITNYLVSFVNGINSGQLSSSTALIEATADDLKDEIYEDEKPADILDRLALLHGYEWGAWHNQALYFRAKGGSTGSPYGRTFYVDVTSLELESDIDPLVNSAYAVYQDANGRTLRGAVSNDTNSQERFGIVRRAALAVRTTSSTQAAAHLAAFLADRGGYALRATVGFDSVYDANGGRRELYELKSSDVLVLRNLPANAGPVIDNIRSFRLARVDYTASPEGVSVEPDVPTPTLVTLLARRGAGL